MATDERPPTARKLDLQPHPEGGWFRETWRSGERFTPAGYPGPRSGATGIYFLLLPGQESAWHRVRGDELWFWHRGGPLELSLAGTGATPQGISRVRLGPDLTAGDRPQRLIPAGTWQAARPVLPQEVLVSCVVSPGFDFSDFTLL